jgi:phosphoenolpyruvate carboxylase
MSEDPHAPLRRDVRELGALLGEVLQEQGGKELFRAVEQVRGLAKQARRRDRRSLAALARRLAALPSAESVPLARAFSHFLTLANIAEQHHRVRRSRQYRLRPEQPPQRASLRDTFERLIAAGISRKRLHGTVRAMDVELVLTAHPTEITRRALLQKYHAIDETLSQRDRPDLTPGERKARDEELYREITAYWHTDEILRKRPTPREEAWSGLLVFEWMRACGSSRATACPWKPRRSGSVRGWGATGTAIPMSRRGSPTRRACSPAGSPPTSTRGKSMP